MFIYLTSKEYPGRTADHNFVRNMARAFTRIIGRDFLLVVAKADKEVMGGINWQASGWGRKRGRVFWYALWLPVFIWRQRKEELAFFSNDPWLLLLLIGWRKILPWKYKIISDWHQMWRDLRDRVIARGSDKLIATSERLRQRILERTGVGEEKVVVARGGVSGRESKVESRPFDFARGVKSKEELRKELGLPVGDFLVGYAGGFKTMGMSKGIETIIKALVILSNNQDTRNNNQTNLNVVLVGGKEGEIEEYKELAERLGVEERVIFRSWQTEEKLMEYERAMDGLIIPYPDEEHFREWGFPMKVYEYMAAGRPIVYSDLEIIREVLGDCATAFKAGSVEDLAEKVMFLIKNKKEAEKLAQKSLEAVKNYTWEERAGKIIQNL